MDHVLAQGAFINCADPLQGVLRLLVPVVGLEFDPDAAERLERMGQHQVFRFGVDRGALVARVQPGAADFDARVLGVDGHVAGRARDLAAGDIDGDEGQVDAFFLIIQRQAHIGRDRIRVRAGPCPFPDRGIFRSLLQGRDRGFAHRLQADMLAGQGDGFDFHFGWSFNMHG